MDSAEMLAIELAGKLLAGGDRASAVGEWRGRSAYACASAHSERRAANVHQHKRCSPGIYRLVDALGL